MLITVDISTVRQEQVTQLLVVLECGVLQRGHPMLKLKTQLTFNQLTIIILCLFIHVTSIINHLFIGCIIWFKSSSELVHFNYSLATCLEQWIGSLSSQLKGIL